MSVIHYTPPPIVKAFIKKYLPGELFYTWIVGPYGSAKTTGAFFKLAYMASLQAKSPDGIRYSHAVVVRNTLPQLRDSTLVSWNYWFQDGVAGEWKASDNIFILRYSDVECKVLFRPLDTPADVARVLGLEVTFAIIDEFREIPRAIIEGLSGRLGRFKPPGDVGCTNFGMWGQSNPGTEDVWWFDHLHGKVDPETGVFEGCVQVRFPTNEDAQRAYQAMAGVPSDDATQVDARGVVSHTNNSWYYKQPSGNAADAENIEHLPAGYYANLAKNKSREWIAQYIDAEWGFSISGKAVVRTFKANLHLSHGLRYNPYAPIVVGLDPGLGGAALILAQQDLFGRVLVLGEIVTQGKAATELMTLLKQYLAARFPNARVILAPDPASANRSSNDKKAVVDTLKKHFAVSIETNNRLPLRLDAIEHYATKLTEEGPALLIDPDHCPVLVRALKGGWRYAVDIKKDEVKGAEPEKNRWSHPGDAFGYVCRYFHRGALRVERQGNSSFHPPAYSGSEYHMQ